MISETLRLSKQSISFHIHGINVNVEILLRHHTVLLMCMCVHARACLCVCEYLHVFQFAVVLVVKYRILNICSGNLAIWGDNWCTVWMETVSPSVLLGAHVVSLVSTATGQTLMTLCYCEAAVQWENSIRLLCILCLQLVRVSGGGLHFMCSDLCYKGPEQHTAWSCQIICQQN